MTSILYGSGLNYQSGNPIRSEIRQVDRKVEELRLVIEKLGGGAADTAAQPAPAISVELEGRLKALHDSVTAISARVDSVGELSMRVQRMESAQVGSSGMLMEMRSLIDKLAGRIDKLEAAAAAPVAAAAPASA